MLPARYALIQQYVRNAAVRTIQEVRRHAVDVVYGSSGTIENLADIAAYEYFNRRRERDDVLTREQLRRVVDRLCELPVEERRRVPGIAPSRADIIIAGAAIIETLMQEAGIPELQISDRGLRDGLLIDYLMQEEHRPLLEGDSVRARSVLRLGRACGIDEPHARHVGQLALELFHGTRKEGLHRFGAREGELLEYSALIHDVGVFLSYSNHHQHSYYLIHNADLLGFDQTEIAIMAASALFHRKGMPRKRKHVEYANLDKRSRRIVRLFALLLRVAESLDRSHTGAIEHMHIRAENNDELILELHARHDCQLEQWGVLNHRKAFRKLFKRKLVVEVVNVAGEAIALTPPALGSAGTPGG